MKRFYSKNCNNSSKFIRQKFIDYFVKENGHTFIKSSSVVPHCDPTLQFVNAGMNQFKGVFLGQSSPIVTRAANYQKCIRVGGKHNDLDIVGSDGYHHTFFEMLGNWSFGDYFKREACELSWALLTGPYGLMPENLYVTYFGGDSGLGLEPDLETLDIWRKIGVLEDHIVPFGVKDNFWEMGLSGPCGPCTEIHYDHTNSTKNRSKEVNKDLSDLTELWNIVFIQYNRTHSGEIKKLPQNFVDTGMGLERLTAVLQGKSSNYETDLFTPIFNKIYQDNKTIREYSGKYGAEDESGLDTAYRIIADHARMTTACLADGMLPEENHKLRKVIRRAMILGNRYFNKPDFMNGVCDGVIEGLGPIYPEMVKNKQQIKNILEYEFHVLNTVSTSHQSPEWTEIITKHPHLDSMDIAEIPSFILGYQEIKKQNISIISGTLAYKLYDTFGLEKSKILQLGHVLGLKVDIDGFDTIFNQTRQTTKLSRVIESKLEFQNLVTDDSEKYNFIEELEAKIICILKNEEIVTDGFLEENEKYSLILDKTNMYFESGGQESDSGSIFINGVEFIVTDLTKQGNVILHNGYCKSRISIAPKVLIKISTSKRENNMKNHTATHILNSILKNLVPNSTTFQKSSRVTSDHLKFDLYVFGSETIPSVQLIESEFDKIIQIGLPVDTKIITEQDLENVALVPGEVYPSQGIRLVQIEENGFVSREACCGTHVRNTKEIVAFCITNFRQNGRAAYSIIAVTGDKALKVKQMGKEIQDRVMVLMQKNEEPRKILEKIGNVMKLMKEEQIPYTVLVDTNQKLTRLKKEIEVEERALALKSAAEEIELAIATSFQPWLVYNLMIENSEIQLSKLTKLCGNLPTLLLVQTSGNTIKARCVVPKMVANERFNAEIWLKSTLGSLFSGKVFTPKGQNPWFVSNMTECKIVNKDDAHPAAIKVQMGKDLANSFAFDGINWKCKEFS